MPDTTPPSELSQTGASRLKNDALRFTPHLNEGTLEAFPGPVTHAGRPQIHTVTINGTVYEWTDETADTVPEEARAIYQRSVEANA